MKRTAVALLTLVLIGVVSFPSLTFAKVKAVPNDNANANAQSNSSGNNQSGSSKSSSSKSSNTSSSSSKSKAKPAKKTTTAKSAGKASRSAAASKRAAAAGKAKSAKSKATAAAKKASKTAVPPAAGVANPDGTPSTTSAEMSLALALRTCDITAVKAVLASGETTAMPVGLVSLWLNFSANTGVDPAAMPGLVLPAPVP